MGAALLHRSRGPDLSLHLHLGRGEAQLSLDGSGGSLHRRGYRAAMGAAPLKENLAAGLIRLTGWDGSHPSWTRAAGLECSCRSGLAALQQAPGLERHFALEGWADFQPELWGKEIDRARQRRRGDLTLPPILGIEADPTITDQARANVEAAGLSDCITIRCRDFRELTFPQGRGVVVCNPLWRSHRRPGAAGRSLW